MSAAGDDGLGQDGRAGGGSLRGPADRAAPRVLLHTRPGCSLCSVARDVVAAVCADHAVIWAEVDIDGPAGAVGGLRARYTDLVPVVTLDGHHHEHWRIDPQRLRRALAAPPE